MCHRIFIGDRRSTERSNERSNAARFISYVDLLAPSHECRSRFTIFLNFLLFKCLFSLIFFTWFFIFFSSWFWWCFSYTFCFTTFFYLKIKFSYFFFINISRTFNSYTNILCCFTSFIPCFTHPITTIINITIRNY